MDEVGGALIAISLVLIAVFLPTAFITGLQGTFYKQFAITIAASTAISAFVSLTLSPAMAALLLKTARAVACREAQAVADGPAAGRSTGSSASSTAASNGCRTSTARHGAAGPPGGRSSWSSMPACWCSPTTAGQTPTGLVPQLDRSYLIAALQLPAGSTLSAPTSWCARPRT